MKMHSFLIPAILSIVIACKPSAPDQASSDTTARIPAATQQDTLASIDPAAIRDLWSNCTSIDIIFYNNNFSMNQTETAAIRNTLGFFEATPVQRSPQCKPLGRIAFLVHGEIRREADVYCSQGCTYFIWMENNTPAYSNGMSPAGIHFFNNVIRQAIERAPSQ